VAETITTAIFATLALLDDTTLTVTENGVGSSPVIATNNTTTYWRIWCASSASPATPSTTPSAPKSLIAHIDNKLGANWTVGLNAAGFVYFTYSGAGNASIVFPDTILRNVLGFQANVSVSSGGTSTAPYHPTHTAYFLGTSNATNWVDSAPLGAFAEPRDGTTYGWTDSAAVQTYSFDGLYHPYDWTARTTLGMSATSSSATPYQGDSTRRKTRSATAGITPPFGLLDFRYACAANNGTAGMSRCGALISTFQSAVSGSTTTYDEVHLSADTLTKDGAFKPSVPNWNARMNWDGIMLRWYATASL
jgi:hypothetical protein